MLDGLGFPAAAAFAWLLALVEFFGGLAVLLGVYTRYAALALAAIMLVTTTMLWTGYMGDGGFLAARLDLLLLASNLSLVFSGPGKWALKEQ
jgi:putative oxidoreductase